MTFAITIHGDPVPKGRARVVNGHTYTPKRTQEAEKEIQQALRDRGATPLSGPLSVTLRFYRKTHRLCDLDNLTKTCLDAGNGYLWDDDSQIVELSAMVERGCANPRTEIVVSAAERKAA